MNFEWPVLRCYEAEHSPRVAMPVGGIGTGTVSVGARGDLRDWEIMDHPAKGFSPRHQLFAIFTEDMHGRQRSRLLEGPLPAEAYEGQWGSEAPNHGFPRFRQCTIGTAYPLAEVAMSDPEMPVSVRMQVFNPFVPADVAASSIPVAVIRFRIQNATAAPVRFAVCGALENYLGSDGRVNEAVRNHNEFRRDVDSGVAGLFMTGEHAYAHQPTMGTMALTTSSGHDVSYQRNWVDWDEMQKWSPVWRSAEERLAFWDEFSAGGRLADRYPAHGVSPVGALSVNGEVSAEASADVTFLLSWHFPYRRSWTPERFSEVLERVEAWTDPSLTHDSSVLTNHYATQYDDAWDVAVKTMPRLEQLESATVQFVDAVVGSDLPEVVREAALFNLNPLRTQTTFRTADGNLFGWEGCDDLAGSCHGSALHVWNYEPAVSSLFGELAQTMRDVEFTHAIDERGLISTRVNLPLERATEYGLATADGQMAAIMRVFRDWQLSGDTGWLTKLWPGVRSALEFCWIAGGWDADQDGVMEGCQHNTMDTDYYGPNPQMGTWYLGALRAAQKMAEAVGEPAFAQLCQRLFRSGSEWIDAQLFNGEYYEHKIVPPGESPVAPGLSPTTRGSVGTISTDLHAPDLQLGAGCLVDQLVGQYFAHVCGLGYLLDQDRVVRALASIFRYNWRESFGSHFNHMRTYALADEQGLIMASYPLGNRPARPFIYFNEVMTGFEYTAAVHMLFEGMIETGLRCIGAVRDRYDGRRRNPFDEAECGHHYVRAMVSWAAIQALTGFQFSAVERVIRFSASAEPTSWFWSNGYAWGDLQQSPAADGSTQFELRVHGGRLLADRIELSGAGGFEWPSGDLPAGHSVRGTCRR